MRILVVEDEGKLADEVARSLRDAGHEAVVAGSGEDGFFLFDAEPFELVLLDLMLPGRDGLDVLQAWRRRGVGVPVIAMTARDAIDDRVRGLDAGADDYLVKPFALAELHARVRALARRGVVEPPPLRLRCGGLDMDLLARTVARDGRPIDLTAREFELLEMLMRHAGEVVTRQMIVKEVWNEPARVVPLDNVIDVHVMRLRRKIDGDDGPALLQTVRGVGFALRPPP